MNISQLYEIYKDHPKVIIDSRKVTDGCLFFSIKGDRFDGNTFAEQALEAGAAFAIIDNPKFKKGEKYILVEDTLKTLQALATHHRRQFKIPVIGITGSNGKTTTKELVTAVLSQHYKTHFTHGNFNNHIGVPLTLLAMPPETQIAVIEMGANHQGEISFLSQITEPTYGLITNIGKAHLEGFGGIEGVKKGKSELYRFLENNTGVAFVNLDERFLKDLSEGIKHRIFYKKSEKIDPSNQTVETILLSEYPFLKVSFRSLSGNYFTAESHLIGIYNLNNIMTAIAVGRYFKVPSEKIAKAIENYIPKNNRSEILKRDTNTFILDAYNANPTSTRNALIHFAKAEAKIKIAILGSMLELGEYSEPEHRDIVDFAVDLGINQVILIGKEFEKIAEKKELTYFENTDQLYEWIKSKTFKDTLFLLKGSRGIGLERILA